MLSLVQRALTEEIRPQLPVNQRLQPEQLKMSPVQKWLSQEVHQQLRLFPVNQWEVSAVLKRLE